MNSSKKQKVADKNCVDFVTAENEVQPNTNVNADPASRNYLNINKLNHDCLANVLMHLPVLDRLEMEKVCQKWQEATKMSSYNFKKINFNDLIIRLDKKEETWRMILEKYGRYMKDLTIKYEYPWIGNVIKKKCHNIIRFDIDMEALDVDPETVPFKVLLRAIRSMPKLKYLKVTINTHECPNFFTRLLDLLPGHIEEIHLITAKYDELDDINWIPIISVTPDKFKSIRCLTLQGFRHHQTIMELILLNSKTLVHLDLSRCELSPGGVSVFSKLCNLEYLNLNRSKNLSVHTVTAIAHNCQKLIHFEYYNEQNEFGERNLVPLGVFWELKYLKNLKYLNFRGIQRSYEEEENSFLSPITSSCKELKHFDVESGIAYSPSDFKEITKLKNLESFNFEWESLDSESLISIANNCLNLKDLITSLTDVDETAIEKLGSLKRLEKLEFYDCKSLRGNLLIDIVNNCTNLIDLDLSSCNNLTEASFLQLGNLQHLKILRLDFINNVPNSMFDNLYKLECLSCAACPSVTDEGIMKVLDNCQNLNNLYLWKAGITSKSLIHAAKRKFIFKILLLSIDVTFEINHIDEEAMESPYLKIRFM